MGSETRSFRVRSGPVKDREVRGWPRGGRTVHRLREHGPALLSDPGRGRPGGRPDYVTVAEAAAELHCHERTIRRAIDRGALRAGRVRGARSRRPDRPLFARDDGDWFKVDDWDNWRIRHFYAAFDAIEISRRRPYDLRHSFVSLMIREGELSIVELADQLGHAATETLKTYAHVFAEYRRPLAAGSPSPEAAWELSLGVYLLVKGFKPSPILLEDVEMEDGPLAPALAGP
jgi:excisionase family DNA binding protein